MTTELKTLLDEVQRVQNERIRNHRNCQVNQMTEEMHLAQLADLRKEIEILSAAGRVAGSEEIPTGTTVDAGRFFGPVSVGTTLLQ